MKIFSTKTHGVLDYLVGIILILSPWLLAFAGGGAETWVPVFIGAIAILYSMFTNYELGIYKIIPIKMHLAIDLFSGILLATSPWLFSFANTVFMPHLIIGIFEIGAVFLTKTDLTPLFILNRRHNPAV